MEVEESNNYFEFVGGNVHLITSKESWEEQLSQASRDGKIVIANFSASWCGPCRKVAPLSCRLSLKYPSSMFLNIDVDKVSVRIVVGVVCRFLTKLVVRRVGPCGGTAITGGSPGGFRRSGLLS